MSYANPPDGTRPPGVPPTATGTSPGTPPGTTGGSSFARVSPAPADAGLGRGGGPVAPRGGLDWRWIGLGAAIMFGLNLIAGLILVPVLGPALGGFDPSPAGPAGTAAGTTANAVADIGGGRLFVGALISFLSFAIGGFIVGVRSAGRTIVEPGISAAIAVAVGLLLSGAFSLGNVLAGGLVPFAAGLLGGWLGERRQGTVGGL